MRLSIKLIFVLLLLLLASSLLLMHGCGRMEAPINATISSPTLAGVPDGVNGSCYPAIVFTVKDSSGNPLSGIGVEIYSSGGALIALAPALSAPTCNDVLNNPPATSIATRTDSYGDVTVEMVTVPTATGNTFSVTVESGSAIGVATTPPTTTGI